MELQQNPDGVQNSGAESKPATPALTDLLTAKPSRAIRRFKEGKAEIDLRIGALIVGIVTMAVTSSLLHQYPNNPAACTISAACNAKPINFLLGTAIMIMIYEALAVILRFLNIKLIITFNTIFLIVDTTVNALLTLFVFIGGCIYFSDIVSLLREYSIAAFFTEVDIGTVVSRCLLMATGSVLLIFMIILTVCMLLFLVKKWNAKLIEQLQTEGMEI